MMTIKTTRTELGDIIRAEAFAFGRFDLSLDSKTRELKIDKTRIKVDGRTKSNPVHVKDKIVDIGAYDFERGRAFFRVEVARRDGGQEGTKHNNHNFYPDGWYVEARRMNQNRTYNPNGELIKFYQSGSFDCVIPEVEVVEKTR